MNLPDTTYKTPTTPSSRPPQRQSRDAAPPTTAVFPSNLLTLGAGTAIFHLATARVVLCYHPRHHLWFLPKGRKDADEPLERAAVREGWEESGYRGRLIGGNWAHTQTAPNSTRAEDEASLARVRDEHGEMVRHRWSTEALFADLMPFAPGSRVQYIVFWYVAETLPPELQRELDEQTVEKIYRHAEPMPHSLTIKDRIAMEPEGYEPPKMAGTGVNPSELTYGSCLVDVEEAIRRLRGTSGILAEVVQKGWEGIKSRERIEAHGHH